jgi:hypothetical protein
MITREYSRFGRREQLQDHGIDSARSAEKLHGDVGLQSSRRTKPVVRSSFDGAGDFARHDVCSVWWMSDHLGAGGDEQADPPDAFTL